MCSFLCSRYSLFPLSFFRLGCHRPVSLLLYKLSSRVEQWKRKLQLSIVKNGSTNKTKGDGHIWLPWAIEVSDPCRVLFNLSGRCWLRNIYIQFPLMIINLKKTHGSQKATWRSREVLSCAPKQNCVIYGNITSSFIITNGDWNY